jgi:glycosyltransferase involved in cell wall biosynthesis
LNILFLTLSQIISDISSRGIYPDLLRKFAEEGHHVYIVCPFERKNNKPTSLTSKDNIHILGVRTLNITKTNVVEKGIGTILIEYQYLGAINQYFKNIHFDLVLYSTPPITFNKIIKLVKRKSIGTITYLLLKDIFPQNAVDLGYINKINPLYWYFKMKENDLYKISDFIGCMSPANVDYILRNNNNIDGNKVEVCPNSIELSVQPQNFLINEFKQKYGIPLDSKIAIYGGNLGKPQGIDFLIDVLKSNINRSDVFFVVAGAGTEFYKLKKFLTNQNPNNLLLLNTLPKNDFDRLVMVSDIGLIFLSRKFSIPNYPSRLLTYLENKIAILLATDENTDVGSIAEKNNYGFGVTSGDLAGFNNKLNFLINNTSVSKEMGINGYNYLLENYTTNNTYEIIMAHFVKP